MIGFSPAEKTEFSERLARRNAELVSEIQAKLAQARAERVAPDAVSVTDGGDKALLEAASGLDLAIVSHDVEELRAIESAQARLAQGTFGVCTDCGDTIVRERLRAYPAAMRCAACQNVFERRRGGLHVSTL
jgi:RNA polymerase-binding transcription factor DksA